MFMKIWLRTSIFKDNEFSVIKTFSIFQYEPRIH